MTPAFKKLGHFLEKKNSHKNLREQYKTTLLKEIRSRAKIYHTDFKGYGRGGEGFVMSLKKAGKI